MVDRASVILGPLVLLSIVACDSTAPPSDQPLHVQGVMLEEGKAPVPPLAVMIQAWPSTGTGDSLATVATDATGRYSAILGPSPAGHLDSLQVVVAQNDCIGPLTTEFLMHEVAPNDDGSLILPSLALSYRLPAAQFGPGLALCGATVTPTSTQVNGDYVKLALWIDDVSDSVRGRWRLNHSASSGDDYGYFSGVRVGDQITVHLRPTQPTPCSGLELDVFVAPNSSRIDPSTLIGDGSCGVPSATVRFFDGAQLRELLPPIAT